MQTIMIEGFESIDKKMSRLQKRRIERQRMRTSAKEYYLEEINNRMKKAMVI